MRRENAAVLIAGGCVLASFLAAEVVSAADQIQHGQQIEGWGTFIDPARDARVTMTGGALNLTVPGLYRDLWPEGLVNSPRILTPVQGDFSVVVKTAALAPTELGLAPDRPATARWPVHGAELLVWQDEDNFVRFERISSDAGHRWYYHSFEGGKRVLRLNGDVKPDVPVHLWIARRQRMFHAGYRQGDEATWTRLEPHRPALLDRVQVGVSIVNSTSEPFTAQFEGFRISAGSP